LRCFEDSLKKVKLGSCCGGSLFKNEINQLKDLQDISKESKRLCEVFRKSDCDCKGVNRRNLVAHAGFEMTVTMVRSIDGELHVKLLEECMEEVEKQL
jgi:CRISPR/Cas system-associated protein Csx1